MLFAADETRGDRMITIGVLDNGFWLDGDGVPMVPPGESASDFSRGFIGLNLQAEGQSAGGAAPTGYPWHGNGTASTAAAVVNNALGAAGSGGTVATSASMATAVVRHQPAGALGSWTLYDQVASVAVS